MSSTNIPKPHPSASLYVGDLLPNVTEGMLFELFSQIGPLASIRVCRDTLTRRSLGYAYVNFHGVVDAERALDTLNNCVIKGRPCRIMWSQRDPSIRKSGVGNIFIKNLDPSIGHKDLYDTFSAFGNILSCKVAMDENGRNSKGFAFVHFENAESAENAIKTVNDNLLGGGEKKVFVGKFQPKKERKKQKDLSWTNVYVKDLDLNVTDKDLVEAFSPYGEITSAVVMRTKDDVSRGFGFVNFKSHESAENAAAQLHQKPIHEKPIWCAKAQKKVEREAELLHKFKQIKIEQFSKYQGINLYIKNIEDEIDEERLKKEFSVYGQIRSAKIMQDEAGNSKGFGFICYTTAEEAQNAINDMNSRILSGCTKPLYVALHEPKDIRRQKLAQRNGPMRKNLRNTNVPVAAPVFSVPGYYSSGSTPFVLPQPIPQPRNAPRAPWTSSQMPPQQYSVGPPGQYMSGRGTRGGRPSAPGARAGGRSGRRSNQPLGAPDMTIFPQDLSLPQLAAFPPEQQKLLLGERLYPLIQKTKPDLAGKITGMLLDSGWSIDELFSLLNNEKKLAQRIDEAVLVLKAAQETGPGGVEYPLHPEAADHLNE